MSVRPLHLAVSIPATGREAARAAAVAERALVDFVVIDDGPLDAIEVASFVAPGLSGAGVLAAASTTRTEPFHVSTGIATLDFTAAGRSGWLASAAPERPGERYVTWDVPADVVADGLEHIDAVRALWDSWEDGAVIRDSERGRFLDRDRVHHTDVRGALISVRGPSITPRPPQGHPIVATRGTALAAAADLVITADGESRPEHAPRWFIELDASDATAERALALQDGGADGLLLTGDWTEGIGALVAALQAAGRFRAAYEPGETLRARLGLPPAVNRFADPTARQGADAPVTTASTR
jgi:hypothetical protein